MIFVFGCLLTTLLALLFNATGWYQIMVQYVAIRYDWSFWVMVGSFASSILAAIDASCIVGCSFAANKLKQEQEANKSKQQTYPIATTNQAYVVTNEPRTKTQQSSNYQTEYFVYQNEAVYQSDSRILRL
jgi:putative Ca2+/H+ antiporter (TMEM165/GDT1 family)